VISDVLAEACDQIREYLNDPVFADVYASKRDEIELLLKQMDNARTELDRLPAPAPPPREGG
jgi:hypothetical protein